jgi:hypothetical protein
VGLGRLATDDEQALLVIGGAGVSQSVTPDGSPAPLVSFANNDFWCDDVSDGPVTAQVALTTGQVIAAEPAWVVVGPPDFAPPVVNFVRTTTTRTIPVTPPPAALMSALLCHPGSRVRRHLITVPAWASVKDKNTPTR